LQPPSLPDGQPEYRRPIAREHIARGFRFRTGETLESLRLAYTVLGHPEGEPVLMLHGTGGSGAALAADFAGELFGPGQPLDADRHFIVLPDAIGHGRSAKPSDGLRARFPRYGYEDMVEGQRRIVREALGLDRLRLVLGVSMGGMHAWQWGVRHPGFMDALMPMACLPAPLSGRNWLLRQLLIDQIRNDPQYAGGDYVEQPPAARAAWEFFNVATSGGTLALQAAVPHPTAGGPWLAAMRARPFDTDANDLVYQYDASRDYDPSGALEAIRCHVLAINSSDDERNPAESGIAQRAMARLAHGRLLVLPGSEHTTGHGTVRAVRLWGEACRDFLASVPSSSGRNGG
jgi:homoserine O-acetyltransferase